MLALGILPDLGSLHCVIFPYFIPAIIIFLLGLEFFLVFCAVITLFLTVIALISIIDLGIVLLKTLGSELSEWLRLSSHIFDLSFFPSKFDS